jgi:hypothetical protein
MLKWLNHTDFLAAGAYILSNIKANDPNMGCLQRKENKENHRQEVVWVNHDQEPIKSEAVSVSLERP